MIKAVIVVLLGIVLLGAGAYYINNNLKGSSGDTTSAGSAQANSSTIIIITDEVTGNPIFGAVVELSRNGISASLITNASGATPSISLLKGELYAATIIKAEYANKATSFLIGTDDKSKAYATLTPVSSSSATPPATTSPTKTYISDEGFMNSSECNSKDYEIKFSLKGADEKSYSYCVKKEIFGVSKSFVIDSYIAFGVEVCKDEYGLNVIPFEVYKDSKDFGNKASTNVKLCLKKQSRTDETILSVNYLPFSSSVCAVEQIENQTFVDGAGETIYHCSAKS